MSDPLIPLLADLPEAAPDPERSERTRRQCRTRLASRVPRVAPSRAWSGWNEIARCWQPLIAAIGLAYLAEVIVLALAVYRGG
jgi:hypothetical protein